MGRFNLQVMFYIFYRNQNSKYQFISKIQYSDPYSVDEQSIECPSKAHCKNGIIVGCMPGYTFVNQDICLNSKQIGSLVFKMYIMSLDVVAQVNSSNICKNKSWINAKVANQR